MNSKMKKLLVCLTVFCTMGLGFACGESGDPVDTGSQPEQSSQSSESSVDSSSEVEESEDSSVETSSEDVESEDSSVETSSEDVESEESSAEASSEDVESEESSVETSSEDVESEDSSVDSSEDSSSEAVTQYTVTFVDWNDEVISTQSYEEGAAVDVPTDPTREADEDYTYTFAGWDKEIVVVAGNATYKATYSKTAIEYSVTFKADGVEVGETQRYSVENKEISVPTVPEKAHYTGVWEEYTLTKGHVVINAVYTPIDYTITFLNGEEEVEVVSFNVEDNEKQAPAIPEKTGYTGTWSEYSFATFDNQTVSVSYTANSYTITYDALGGTVSAETQEVTYDSEYTLATAVSSKSYQEFLGWQDENGNVITSETWNIADNVTLKAVYSKGMTFDALTEVPTGLKASNHAGTATIGEKDGDKCLVVPVTGSTPYLLVTRAFLAEFFEDPNVAYLAFDAKTKTLTTDNFRRYTMKADGSAMHYVWYEQQHDYGDNAALDGVSSESWKSFYFSREDYNHWVDNDIEEQTLIYATGFSAEDEIYVDNIRPVTAQERIDDIYSFETGWMMLNGTNLLTYDSIGAIKKWQLGVGFNSAENQPTAFGLTNDLASHGGRALSFTKPAGNIADYFVRLNDAAFAAMTSAGYYAFDLYVPEGADTTLTSGETGYTIATPKVGGWTTIYVNSTNNKPVNIKDTTGGTYAIDHFRSVTAEEYTAAKYGFEAGAGALRTDVLESENRFYYYVGSDNRDKKISLNVKGDGSTISNVRMDMENVHGGNYSLAFEKTDGYAFMSLANTSSAMYEELKNGFTFWIYSTVVLNGTGDAKNFINGHSEQFGDEGVAIPANTWVQVTITAEDINDSGRFLIIQGSTAGTIYLDDFCPLSKSAE